jgi:carboxymethylenebutenolidase
MTTIELKTEKVQIPVEGAPAPMPGYLAMPAAGKGPLPAVIVFEEIFGVNSHIRDVTERVARLGYVAIAPDYHHRAAPGQELGYDDAGMKAGMPLIQKLTMVGLRADLRATRAFLGARAGVRADRLGCIGFCIGGHAAFLAACELDLRATASFYGGGIAAFTPGGGPPSVTRAGELKGKVLCFFGAKDAAIPAAQVDTIKKALAEHKVRHEVVVYPECGHGFFCDQRGSYHAGSAKDAWGRVTRLFAEELA